MLDINIKLNFAHTGYTVTICWRGIPVVSAYGTDFLELATKYANYEVKPPKSIRAVVSGGTSVTLYLNYGGSDMTYRETFRTENAANAFIQKFSDLLAGVTNE